MGYRIGVDIGGSFTDFAVFDENDGSIKTLKVFSRPDAPGQEVVNGMTLLDQRLGISAEQVTYFTHGTTVGVNAVIQRKGQKLALLTTRNFEDVLELARLKIGDMYHLMSSRPAPLVPRNCVFGIDERMNADGSVEMPVDTRSVRRAVDAAKAFGCDTVVISLLHAYRNPQNERDAREVIASYAPDLPVIISSDVWPIIREYERTITAVISGYVQPRVSNYLSSLQAALTDAGVGPALRVTKSNGGIMLAEQGKQDCIQMILSGTASGVIGASYIAELCGLDNCLSLDIGGTSADVALIVDGSPRYATGELIGDFQIHIPSVSVSSIGEGGGSIAWIDDHGILKVGPESAGSSPGPVCFGRGGTRPTISDAFVTNGWIGHEALGYEAVNVDRAAATQVLAGLGAGLGRSPNDAADAVINIAVSSMYSGISGIVSRYGVDPRVFSLIAFGGAGPMMGCFLARDVGIRRIVVPPTPGVLSALGGLIADLKNDFVRTTYCDLDAQHLPGLWDAYSALREQGLAWLEANAAGEGETRILLSAEMRYKGQSFELETPVEAAWIESGDLIAIAEAFHREHLKVYGLADREAPVQVVALRVVALRPVEKPKLALVERGEGVPAKLRDVDTWIDGNWESVPLYARAALKAGHAFDSPAIVAQPDCTTCIPPGFRIRVDDFGNMHIESRE